MGSIGNRLEHNKTVMFDVDERGHHIVVTWGVLRIQLLVDGTECDFKKISDRKPIEFTTDDNMTIAVKDVGKGYVLCVNDIQIAQYGKTK